MTEEIDLRQWAVTSAIEMGADTVAEAMEQADLLVDYVMGLSTAGKPDV